jgi:hypothetical protein
VTRRKTCRAEGCVLPKEPPRHFCAWHALAREPIDRQVSAAKVRLAMVPEELRLARVDETLWPVGWRWCAGCQSLVPRFYTSGSRCSACSSESAHGAMIERTYSLTADQYAALLELQDGRCAVCRAKPKTVRLAVDHDHRSGRTRGLLCSKCNHELLGAAHDSLELLENAVAYIKEPPASGTWSPPKGEVKRPLPKAVETVLGSIPYHLSAADGYRLSGSRGQEVIYILRSALEAPF